MAVVAFLGHKNAAETLNAWSHLWPTDQSRIAAAIDGWLNSDFDSDVYEVCTIDASEEG